MVTPKRVSNKKKRMIKRMIRCKFNNDIECELFDNPKDVCWYESLEDCLCFRTGKYNSVEDVKKGIVIHQQNKLKREYILLKKLLLKIWRSPRE